MVIEDFDQWGDREEIENLIEFEELKESLLSQYDPEELVDVLQITGEDIVERFEDYVVRYFKK